MLRPQADPSAAAPLRSAPSAPPGRLVGLGAVPEQGESKAQPHRPQGVMGVPGAMSAPAGESPTKRRSTNTERPIKESTSHYDVNLPSLRRSRAHVPSRRICQMFSVKRTSRRVVPRDSYMVAGHVGHSVHQSARHSRSLASVYALKTKCPNLSCR